MTDHRLRLPPVGPGVDRPLWSVMIPTFHCAALLRETLASVLSQDPGPETMQIEVVDDCSTDDDPEAVVRELGRGRVGFFRQPRNVGHVRNFETCLLRSRGRLVHLLHGDDRVLPGFYRVMQRPFENGSGAGAAFCRHTIVDDGGRQLWMSWLERPEAGLLRDWLPRIAERQRLQTVSMVVGRDVYERLGGFDRRIERVGEDWEMWVRIAASYPVWFEPTPLAEYRQHAGGLTGGSVRTGRNVRDLRRVIEINGAHFQGAERAAIERRARRACAHFTLDIARRAAAAGHWGTAWVQIREALRTSRAARVLVRTARISALTLASQLALPVRRASGRAATGRGAG